MRNISMTELADVVCAWSSKHKVMVMLRAYFDESGMHKEAPSVVMAGFVGSSAQWQSFDGSWRSVLARYDVEVFHASPCAKGHGEFAGKDEVIRTSLALDLADVICASGIQSLAFGLDNAAWKEVSDVEFKKTFPTSYSLGFQYCLQRVKRFSEVMADGEDVALVFADHQEHGPLAQVVFDHYKASQEYGGKLASLTFASPKKFSALQAADLFAYETYQWSSGFFAGKEVRRRVMERFFDSKLVLRGEFLDAGSLAAMIAAGPSGRLESP
ncbi:MAG: DUF3800 domain-containing protein [Dokdonella sp.]